MRDPNAPGSSADIELSAKTMLRTAKRQDTPKPPIAEEGYEPDTEPAEAPPIVLSAAQEQQKKQLLQAAEELDKKLQAVESRLVSQALRDSADKYFVEPYGVYLDLIWLYAEVETGRGDAAGSADFAPTETQLDLLVSGRSFQQFTAENLFGPLGMTDTSVDDERTVVLTRS